MMRRGRGASRTAMRPATSSWDSAGSANRQGLPRSAFPRADQARGRFKRVGPSKVWVDSVETWGRPPLSSQSNGAGRSLERVRRQGKVTGIYVPGTLVYSRMEHTVLPRHLPSGLEIPTIYCLHLGQFGFYPKVLLRPLIDLQPTPRDHFYSSSKQQFNCRNSNPASAMAFYTTPVVEVDSPHVDLLKALAA